MVVETFFDYQTQTAGKFELGLDFQQ